MSQAQAQKPRHSAAGRPKRKPGGCPVGEDALQVAAVSHDLVRALRRLRRDLQRCQACPRETAGCLLRGEYNALVGQAVEEVWEEWAKEEEFHGGN